MRKFTSTPVWFISSNSKFHTIIMGKCRTEDISCTMFWLFELHLQSPDEWMDVLWRVMTQVKYNVTEWQLGSRSSFFLTTELFITCSELTQSYTCDDFLKCYGFRFCCIIDEQAKVQQKDYGGYAKFWPTCIQESVDFVMVKLGTAKPWQWSFLCFWRGIIGWKSSQYVEITSGVAV